MLSYLFRPFGFLGIRHQGWLFVWLNWLLPFCIAATATLLLIWAAPTVNLYSAEGLFVRTLGFVQNLPGFYIAALAAIATFNQPALDKLMPGTPPTAQIVYNGQLVKVDLTRRRFLCLLFSYLTAISFLLTISLISATSLAAPMKDLIEKVPYEIAYGFFRWGTCWILIAGLTQMLTVTFYGLFYIGERMHTSDI